MNAKVICGEFFFFFSFFFFLIQTESHKNYNHPHQFTQSHENFFFFGLFFKNPFKVFRYYPEMLECRVFPSCV